ncbi:alpha/beta hydrolase fold domain-containing protein [Primorskyibacter sp. 2E107]|uniref:alpha/beta hydrolase fold domain-containing protein n=1 Tax=Primorskyibacter sp. 2E107 TaxID=3403458 RepID=UPI003AF90EAE
MHPDFRKLAALRRFVTKGDPRSAEDFGRAAAARWVARHAPAIPDGVTIEKTAFGRRITPAGAGPDRLIYIHGGGLVYYDTEVFSALLGQIAAQTGFEVLALDYPKAPETPAQQILAHLGLSLQTLLAADPAARIILAGDSVGGLLAAHLARIFGSRIDALHLLYPVTALATDPGDPHGSGHFLDTDMMDWFYGFIAPLGAAPMYLPETIVHIAQADILAPQARHYAQMAKAEVIVHPGLPHDFALFSGSSEVAATAVAQIAARLKAPSYA